VKKGRVAATVGVAAILAVLLFVRTYKGRSGGGALHARRAVVQREVDGLRAVVARLEKGEAFLPEADVAIALDDTLVRDLLAAQLPFEIDVDRFHVRLDRAEMTFRGSPLVTLEGTIAPLEQPTLSGAIRVLGSLTNIAVDSASGSLRASVTVDHVDLKTAAGLEGFLSAGALDELSRQIRVAVADRIPEVVIPVSVQQQIELPAVTEGPVRLDGATLPLQVAVSQVLATNGRLWVAVHVEAGRFTKTVSPRSRRRPRPGAGGHRNPRARTGCPAEAPR
jgi:hypothetical protein